ncbi:MULTISPECIES: ABC transporter permease [Alphaproteobacteria]|uniref:Spermidine/putrescine ABC transporter permease n=2 Tax=Alphaproteobacteria TaxID=28211 RepID=A0A512HGY1_9HYPH|nr:MULTISPECIES: ABC transporter permease [Alphaproteobacteria]GEO84715.1 spermidine/putrescine ABC transporter permease [Ciceribacter naphthalenivorans]GLR20664.1 spermidine/putrescine ABC transporter permease [Ciceribacter naphthalenivorans]GLT03520.1 spermidine/putrescine ABC transporter permease [Sphingomonas psychrolutea]
MHKLIWWQKSLVGVAIGTLLFLYVPVAILILFSFNDSPVTSFPLSGFTWGWYQKVFANADLIRALGNSLMVASAATVLTIVIGVPAALALDRYPFIGKQLFRNTILLPLSLPGIVTGIAMLNFYKQIGLPQSLGAVIIGHATALTGIVVSQVLARLEKVNRNLSEASSDLGATSVETFFYVTLPNIRSAIIGSALLSFTLSFDEIPVTYFLTGREITLPMYIYSTLRRGITPEINAIGTLIVVVSLVVILSSVSMLRQKN